MSCVCPLISYRLATEENVHNVRVRMMQSLSNHNTQPKTISNIHTRYILQRAFRENVGDFTELHNEKNQSGSYV